MREREVKRYSELFNTLDSNDPNYIDIFIGIIIRLLTERNDFVKSSEDDSKRREFILYLREVLKKIRTGNEPIEFISSGHSSLAFKVKDKVLKIGKSNIDIKKLKRDFPCTIPLFLDECYNISPNEFYTIQVTPIVDTIDVSEEDLYPTYCRLRKCGYVWNDPKCENIGRIRESISSNGYEYKKGDIVIIDLEDLAYIGENMPDVVLDEIGITAYNPNVYNFEIRYIEEKRKGSNQQK